LGWNKLKEHQLTKKDIEKAFAAALQKYPVTINVDIAELPRFLEFHSVNKGDVWQVPQFFKAKILGGTISHVTGTTTTMSVRLGNNDANRTVYFQSVDAAEGSGSYNLNQEITNLVLEYQNSIQILLGAAPTLVRFLVALYPI